MKVQILKAGNPNYWYAKRIGETFYVRESDDGLGYMVARDSLGGESHYIHKEDAIQSTDNKQILYVTYSCGRGPNLRNCRQLINAKAPRKVSDVKALADTIIEKHPWVEDLTILNWKELDMDV